MKYVIDGKRVWEENDVTALLDAGCPNSFAQQPACAVPFHGVADARGQRKHLQRRDRLALELGAEGDDA